MVAVVAAVVLVDRFVGVKFGEMFTFFLILQQGGGLEEIRLVVPASRTGTVIGRGGETIRALKQQSGCNIELDKSFQSDNEEKCFIIRGTADKIGYAQQLVTDKVGGHATVIANSMQANPLYK